MAWWEFYYQELPFVSPWPVASQEFYYMQMVLGFVPGYIFVAYLLMLIYYKMKVYSIYEYLKDRF